MFWSIIVTLVVLWLAGFLFDVVGGPVHVVLVIAAMVFVVQMLTRRQDGA